MARKLRTFQTSLVFFDLAIAAPSMKDAMEAWGAGSNLFHQGVAKETDDPDVVAATMSNPGVVLKRPTGYASSYLAIQVRETIATFRSDEPASEPRLQSASRIPERRGQPDYSRRRRSPRRSLRHRHAIGTSLAHSGPRCSSVESA